MGYLPIDKSNVARPRLIMNLFWSLGLEIFAIPKRQASAMTDERILFL